MKDPKALPKLKLEYVLPFQEVGMDAEDIQSREIAKELKQFYFGFSTLSVETILTYLMVFSIFIGPFNPKIVLKKFFFVFQILTDKLFAHPTHRLILSRAQNESASTYLLRFNFESKYNMVKKVFVGRNVPGNNWLHEKEN